MAHQIEQNYAFFASSKPAWHGLGTVLNTAPSIAEAWKLAYPFEVFQLPVSAKLTDDQGIDHHTDCPDHAAIVRSDGKVLSVMSDRYGVVQPYDVFQCFEPLIEAGLVELEAGGSLKDGKKMWALGKVKGADAEILPGDRIKAYLLFHTSFDGSCKLGAGLTGVRVVCANTLASAQSAGLSHTTKHTKGVKDRLDAIAADLEQVIKSWAHNVELYRTLAEKKVTKTAQQEYIVKVIAPELLDDKKEVHTKTKNKVRFVLDMLDYQRGKELVPAAIGTAWQAYNAVSEYLTHENGRDADSRVDSQYFGEGARLNSKALDLALSM
jgi:phage/plasmid-like protein (TIGR03299 family)